MDTPLGAVRWDDEYRHGRYAEDPPIPFVHTIVATLLEHRFAWEGVGLYVGCGNGRNYLPLVDARLNLYGLDISQEAISRLAERWRAQASQLVCTDVRRFESDVAFSYIIAIQVFQHGGDPKTGYWAQWEAIWQKQ